MRRLPLDRWLSTPVTIALLLTGLALGSVPLLAQEPARGFGVRASADTAGSFGTYHALLIGVADYRDPAIQRLAEPVRDARALRDVLIGGYDFAPQNVTVMENPTGDSLLAALDHYATTLGPGDNLVVFYAGHGIWDDRFEQGYWLPSDAVRSSRATWIPNGTIRDYLRGMRARHVLLITDACFSGGILVSRGIEDNLRAAALEHMRLPSRKVMTSGALTTVPDQSVFVRYLVRRLEEVTEPVVTAEAIFASLQLAVSANSPNRQTPQYGFIQDAGHEGGEFVFLRRQLAAGVAGNAANHDPVLPAVRSPDAALWYDQGSELFQRGDYAGMTSYFRRACELGEPRGCGFLGWQYELGNGVPVDRARGARLNDMACAGGDEMACYRLGNSYLNGQGVTLDMGRARDLFSRGCDAGAAQACTMLGWMYMTGTGVEPDLGLGTTLYDRACDGGDLLGCNNLGFHVLFGDGVPQDYARAIGLLSRACDGGEPRGCTNLGDMYRDGMGVPVDLNRAAGHYSRGCDGGNPYACEYLGSFHLNGQAVARDLARAQELFSRACDGGAPGGCNGLAWMFETGTGVEKDMSRSATLYAQACSGGHAMACNNLGISYRDGLGVTPDTARALELISRACDFGEPHGCFNLGWMYQKAIGVMADQARAMQLFQSACDARHQAACDQVAALADTPGVVSNRPPTQPLLIDDNFETARELAQSPPASTDPCVFSYANGGYRISDRHLEPVACMSWHSAVLPPNVRIETAVALLEGSTTEAYWLGFGRNSQGEFYGFTLAANGRFKLWRSSPGGSRDLIPWTPSTVLHTGLNVVNQLAVEIRGREVTLYANNEHIADYVVDSEISGQVLFGLNNGITVLFEHLRVLELGVRD